MKKHDITSLFSRKKDDPIDFTDIILNKEELLKHAKEIARKHEVYKKAKLNKVLIRRLSDNFDRIAFIYRELNERANKKRGLSLASEWLLDNFYKLEEQIKEVVKKLEKERFMKLNCIKNGFWKGYPRIFVSMIELIAHSDANLDEDTLVEFVKEYQSIRTLSISEIWSISLVLRVAIIDFIRLISEKAYKIEKGRALADQIMEREKHELINELKKISNEEMNSSFIEYFLRELRKNDIDSGEVIAYIENNHCKHNTTIKRLIDEEHKEQTALKISIGNAIVSLNEVAIIDWSDIFESLSFVEKVLREDPAGIYPEMDFESRDYYRNQIELIAKKHHLEEILVAKKAVECACMSDVENESKKKKHVGYFLINRGRKELFSFLGINTRCYFSYNERLFLYFAPIAMITATITLIIYFHLNVLEDFRFISYSLMLLPVVSISAEIAVVFTNRMMMSIFTPVFLPRLEYEGGIPKKSKTLVVIPALIDDVESGRQLVKQLEVYYLANKEENIYFAIAGDFKDAKECELEEDKEIIEMILEDIKKLNKEYNYEENIFYYFHRKRQYSDKQQKWMGWERKRGALTELNRLILGIENTSYSTVSSEICNLRDVEYIITIDADTQLIMDTAKKLIGIISHPLNRAEIDEEKGIVVGGYGIIQPKIGTEIDSASRTLYSKLFAGKGGVDSYTTAYSDVYQDLFGEGIFVGKGIYDLRVFSQVLKNVVPDNTILSHDLLEGIHVRAGLASDIELIDSFPGKYLSFMKRLHRWTRGDWQLIKWLGISKKSKITIISKWKIIDNLRRSVVPINQILFFVLGAIFVGENIELWFVFAITSVLFPHLLTLADDCLKESEFLRSREKNRVITSLKRFCVISIVTIVFLPYKAYVMLDAISRTLFRVYISKKNLLEWVTAANIEKKHDGDLWNYYKVMSPAIWITVGLLIATILLRPSNIIYSIILFVLWGASPLLAYLISRDKLVKKEILEDEENDVLAEIAKDTWAYYDNFVNTGSNFLPPDNFQEYPPNKLAHRTSPTNIGLYLMSILCARDFNYISAENMLNRINETITTIEKMETWKGHLYNWYDTRTLEVLRPQYISTVDSGNFISYLITINEGLKACSNQDESSTKLNELSARISKIIEETKFVHLYDAKRHLFSIGYHVQDEKLTNSYYDLLASEARIVSYIAIARREIPMKHWFKLGRALTNINGEKCLVSWTGTMFEYFMPYLIMKNYEDSVLDITYATVIKAQKKYGKKRKVPWGVSESGYYDFDLSLNYQYKAFGVPDLGLKRGLREDTVISPYATLLTLPYDSYSAMKNIYRIISEGAKGSYGLYEALDYTTRRIKIDDTKKIIKSYMAHHLGMSIVAINNYLNGNIMQKRFHSSPIIKSAEILLQERISTQAITTKEYKESLELPAEVKERNEVKRNYGVPENFPPKCNILSNGSYSVMITSGGGGYSKFNNIYINRWRRDAIVGRYGTYLFIKKLETNQVWSTTYEPQKSEPDAYKVIFSQDKAEFLRTDDNIDTHTRIIVSPEDNAEVRNVTITNHGQEAVTFEVTSYFETVIAEYFTDISHPAFSNLFIITEAVPKYNSIISKRRSRDEKEDSKYVFSTMVVEGETIGNLQYETNRESFIGRGRDISNPRALETPLSNFTGVVIDPIMSLRRTIKIGSSKSAVISLITGFEESRENAIETIKKYQDKSSVSRSFKLAFTRSEVETKYLDLTGNEIGCYQAMITHILYPSPIRRKYEAIIKKNTRSQRGLWAYGISGDIPIVLVSISKVEDIDIIKDLLKAHEYWRIKGLEVDLVILNEDEASYLQPLMQLIDSAVLASYSKHILDQAGGVFVRKGNAMPEEDIILLNTVARINIKAELGSLKNQIIHGKIDYQSLPKMNFKKSEIVYLSDDEPINVDYFNEYGGFSKDGKEYIIKFKENIHTPAPWVNVIANSKFGFMVTESGAGYTWSENSRENKLTPWTNDPVSDSPSEVVYIRDEENGDVWTITPLPIREVESYLIRHGLGYTTFEHKSNGISQSLTLFVPNNDSIKINLLKIKNTSSDKRKLSVYYYIRPVLGVSEEISNQYIATKMDEKSRIITMQNSFNGDFPGRIGYVATSEPIHSYTCNREEFVGVNGSMKKPVSLERVSLSNTWGVGYDPCVAIQVIVELEVGEEKEITFLLGLTKDKDEIVELVNKYREIDNSKSELDNTKNSWVERLETIQVKTPDLSMNLMLNYWLMYQTISCRIWGRSAFYQSGGAYGFRDQLQDTMNTIYLMPEMAKEQILLHCKHQFIEGDVQHWWHPSEEERGIRTRFSDDLLWLPFATAEYIRHTQDYDILNEETHFLEGEHLVEGVDEKYTKPDTSAEKASVYNHCIRAIEHALKFGENGIPLMGSGDWNDGMNTVGNKGKGESVWLGWFLYSILNSFSSIVKDMNEPDRANRYTELAKKIANAIEKNAWDGAWYLRAFYDDGSPLGASKNAECIIDSLAQSWSIISGGGKLDRSKLAMESVDKNLIKKEEGLILLFTPPFDKSDQNPGYIKAYVPGVRENGGQYTHAATWVINAYAMLGEGDKACKLFNAINPINHSRTSLECATYKVEPYVMAADVYAVSPHIGRGGWTWYTGAAGWMYRVGIEHILGFKKEGNKLRIDPCIPKDWKEFNIKYKYGSTTYNIQVKNPDGVNGNVEQIIVDGQVIEEKIIVLSNKENEHNVEILLGGCSESPARTFSSCQSDS